MYSIENSDGSLEILLNIEQFFMYAKSNESYDELFRAMACGPFY